MLNVNILKKYLYELDALSITVANFVIIFIPALVVLFSTGFFTSFQLSETTGEALIYITVLAVIGTGLAKVLFNRLIQLSTPVFSSSVTYLIPIVAITWGLLDGEKISLIQFLSGAIILLGVYLANKSN